MAIPEEPQSRVEEYLAYIILNGVINLQKGDGVYSIKQTADPSKTGGKFVLNNPNSELNGKAQIIGSFGDYSSSFGGVSTAIGKRSLSEGTCTVAKGKYSHAEGDNSVTEADDSHAEGYQCTSKGVASHSEGGECMTNGAFAHAEGKNTTANGGASHTEGKDTYALSDFSHAEGTGTRAVCENQHVQGRFNAGSTEYAHIVGNGKSDAERSNAHTVDWNGNGWFAGTVEGTALILKSSTGKKFKITVNDSGTISAVKY